MSIHHLALARLAAGIGSLFLALASAGAETFWLRALMDGAQAGMGNGTGSPGTGVAYVTYDDVTGELTWNVSWQDVTGTPTAMHFHGPAPAGQDAGVVQPVGVAANPAVGSATITPAQAADLLAGLWYINLHTSDFTDGEIRGQVLPAVFSDDFSEDLSQWTVTGRGLENNGPSGYTPPSAAGGELTLGGTTTGQYWFGSSIESIQTFSTAVPTEVRVRRVSLAGSGTAWRSTIWIFGDAAHYLHYSQNVNESGWSWNARDDNGGGSALPTGSGNQIPSLDPLDSDGGSFVMSVRIEPEAGAVRMTMLLDGTEAASHVFTNFPDTFQVVLTGQARAVGDSVTAVFDDLAVFQSPGYPIFSDSEIVLPHAPVGAAYSADLTAFVADAEEDPVTFTKVGGPAWLDVAPDGSLSGAPVAGDLGLNEFFVAASDESGSTEAMLLILVSDPAASGDPRFFGWWPLNEGSGSLAEDISGHGRHAIIRNAAGGGLGTDGAAWAEDPELGPVLSFNGVNGHGAFALVGDPPAFGGLPVFMLDPADDFTWAFWARSEQTVNNDIILGNRYNTSNQDYAPREFIKFTPAQFEWHQNGVGSNINYDDLPVGEWHHHAVVKDGSSISYYRDGAFVSSASIPAAPLNSMPTYFGGQGLENWRGYLFDIRLLRVALSDAEVLEVFESRGQFSLPSDLLFTAVVLDESRNLELTWTSSPGATYAVEFTSTLSGPGGGWIEIDDSVASDGALTTYTIPAGAFPFPGAAQTLIFRVVER